jgi:gas vesicle protein
MIKDLKHGLIIGGIVGVIATFLLSPFYGIVSFLTIFGVYASQIKKKEKKGVIKN